jgi:FkbM family methyltransferase
MVYPYIEHHKVWDNWFKLCISNDRDENWYGLKTICDDLKCSWDDAVEVQNKRNLFLRDLISPGDVVIDVGANIGSVALSMVMRSKSKIIVIEANPSNIPIIKRNFQLNDVIDYQIYSNIADEKSGMKKFISEEMVDSRGTEVETIALDDLGIAPDVIKIDVEGYEIAVLRGAKEMLKKKPKLEIETHLFEKVSMEYHGFDPQELLDILYSNGYEVYLNGQKCEHNFELKHNMFLHCR